MSQLLPYTCLHVENRTSGRLQNVLGDVSTEAVIVLRYFVGVFCTGTGAMTRHATRRATRRTSLTTTCSPNTTPSGPGVFDTSPTDSVLQQYSTRVFVQNVRWLSSKHDVNVPGEGFGGGGGFDSAPIKHLSPNTDPWAVNTRVSCPETRVPTCASYLATSG